MTDCDDDTKDLNILTDEFSDEALETASGIGASKLGTLHSPAPISMFAQFDLWPAFAKRPVLTSLAAKFVARRFRKRKNTAAAV